jgi:transposase
MVASPEERAARNAAMVRSYENGMSLKQIEKRYDVAVSQAKRILRAAGVTLRPPGNVSRRWGDLTPAQAREYRERLKDKQ